MLAASDMPRRATAPRWAIVALVGPLLIFLLAAFFLPVGTMLKGGVIDSEVPAVWPKTTTMLRQWDGTGLPPATIAPTMADDMLAARRAGTLNRVANRLNYDMAGSRSFIFGTADRIAAGAPARNLADLAAIDQRWGQRATWAELRHASGPLTSFFVWAALDRRVDADGAIVRVAPEQRVFVDIFGRTFKISAIVALLCVLLGYPVAYLLAHSTEAVANRLLIVVLLPFWTSTLVRTTAWVVLLQTNGVVNNLIQWLGLADEPLPLLYNRMGVYIAMTHVLLPFLILPLYGVMRGIRPEAMRAALSLGAHPAKAFLRVYLPQTLPGVAAGAAIVFALALGYYLTPALVGGGSDQLVGASIAFYTNESLNWGMAAALSLLLLAPLLIVMAMARGTNRLWKAL
ncbi:MAG: ABC transporter permease [Pseudomonadota bacterium]